MEHELDERFESIDLPPISYEVLSVGQAAGRSIVRRGNFW